MQLNEKVRKLESELGGTYKDRQVSTMQVLDLTNKVNDIGREKKEVEERLQAAQEYNNQNAIIINQKVRDEDPRGVEHQNSRVGGGERERPRGKQGAQGLRHQDGKVNLLPVGQLTSLRRRIIDLTNDNQNLLNKIVSMKTEMVEKMNDANDIYQKALEMMKKTQGSPSTSSPSSAKAAAAAAAEKLDDYMMSTLSVPVKSSVLSRHSPARSPRDRGSRSQHTRTRHCV